MIASMKLIKILLAYFLVSRLLTALAIKLTGNFLVGTLAVEASMLAIFIIYMTYHMYAGHYVVRMNSTTILLFALLFVAISQGIHIAIVTNSMGFNSVVQSFAPFRRYFFPLPFFFVFNYLLSLAFKKKGELVFAEIYKYLKLILYVAIFYQFAEAIFRMLPIINSMYTDYFISPIMNADGAASATFDKLAVMTKTYFPFGYRIQIIRVFGVGLDYFVSGSMIFLCYVYNALFMRKFKVLSVFNALVLSAIILTGTLQFIVPYFLFNIYMLYKNSSKNRLINIIGILALSAIAGGFFFRIFDPERGYGTIFMLAAPFIVNNIGNFMFGIGAIRTNLDIGSISSHGELNIKMLDMIADVGIFVFLLEVGLIAFILYFIFYANVLVVSGPRHAFLKAQKDNIGKLRFILTFVLVVCVAHYAILFSRMTYVYFIFLLSMLYSYSMYLRQKKEEPVEMGAEA